MVSPVFLLLGAIVALGERKVLYWREKDGRVEDKKLRSGRLLTKGVEIRRSETFGASSLCGPS